MPAAPLQGAGQAGKWLDLSWLRRRPPDGLQLYYNPICAANDTAPNVRTIYSCHVDTGKNHKTNKEKWHLNSLSNLLFPERHESHFTGLSLPTKTCTLFCCPDWPWVQLRMTLNSLPDPAGIIGTHHTVSEFSNFWHNLGVVFGRYGLTVLSRLVLNSWF